MTLPGPVILDADEAGMAAVAVRMYLAHIRADYRKNVRLGEERYIEKTAAKFDNALDLYERLGGDVDRVLDLDEVGAP